MTENDLSLHSFKARQRGQYQLKATESWFHSLAQNTLFNTIEKC